MTRLLFVICLAVLIGNPGCCCAFALPMFAASQTEAAVDLPPCCRAKALAEGRSPIPNPDEPREPSCPCSKRLGFVPADKVLVPFPSPSGSTAWISNPISVPAPGWCRSPEPIRMTPRSFTGVPPPLYLLHQSFLC